MFEASGQPDLLVINVSEHVHDWELAAQVRRCDYRGRIIALVDDLFDASARALTQLGAVECIVRPSAVAALEDMLQRVILGSVPPGSTAISPNPPKSASFHGIVGRSPKLLEIFSRIEKVASGDANVCICGESGTGKELIARAIHYVSPRRDRPLITLDCTTIPEGLMESHVLGHVKGAFTGAVEHREGVFALAHTGTLFIDELCELNPVLQGKLLRVIQNREFVPIGGTKPKRTDVRIITATNKDLKHEVEKGTFREDLYYRVAVFMINVPPLRERREDIPSLVDYFTQKLAALYGKAIAGVDSRALKRLEDMPWPGNVRQLENFVEQAVVLAEGDTLTELELFASHVSTRALDVPPVTTFEPGLPLSEVERRHILNTLRKVGGNRTEAARQLGISIRSLHYKLKEYSADPHSSRESPR
ncbi:MAG TPA: sigma-54 dependent transcriptional regulator [Candidatus Acidoferrum sp.]|nr:sigma-54 dependent transcriptional regulator [Candidatus Acidoferrum sp.]